MKTLAKKPISVFISYAREDAEQFAEKLYQNLKKNGFKVWWDRATMINRGRTFLQEIMDAIENSDHLIAVIGPKAVDSKYVRYEWEHALLFSKSVIPILLMGDHSLMPPEMSKLHCPDFRANRPYEKALEELIRLLREPVPSLGRLIGIPSLPPNYLPRKDDLNKIKELMLTHTIKPVVITYAKQVTALQGMGGIGKSVLASAFARTNEARKDFYDGIFWITIGLEVSDSEASVNMRLIGTNLGDDPANYSTKKEAEASLSKALSGKVCLIILDNIWRISQATPFINALGSRCRLLITTRNDDVVTSLGAQEYKIKVISKPESLKLLANWCEKDANSLPSEVEEVARECGYLPLALSICGAMAKSGIAWSDILEALQEADLEFIEAQLPNYPDKNVGRALKVSIDFLFSEDPDAVKRYQELAVFPEDEFIPEAAITILWVHTGNMKKRNVEKLLTKLKDRSLLRLDGEHPNRLISLHDLHFDYLRATADDLPGLHNNLLEAYGKEYCNKWGSGPSDSYFFENLAYHMKEAGKREELRKLLLNFEWMCSKLKKECVTQNETREKMSDTNSFLHDYNYLPDDTEIGLTQDAIKLSYKSALNDKTQLTEQILGRFLCFHENEIQVLLNQAAECRNKIRLLPTTSSLKPHRVQSFRIFEGHDECVNAIAITPNGKCLVSASKDKTIKVWNLERGTEKITLKGHYDCVNAIAITPNGKYLVSASSDKTLKVWDLKTKKKRVTLRGHDLGVSALAITPDGKYVVSASKDKTLKVWNLKKGEEKKTLKGHNDPVNAVVIAPDGKHAVSASDDETLKVWDLKKGEEKMTLKGHNDPVNAVAITPDGKYAISASDDKTLKIWDLEKGALVSNFIGNSSFLTCDTSPDGETIVAGDASGKIHFLRLERPD
jgi:WD40 repeat protein